MGAFLRGEDIIEERIKLTRDDLQAEYFMLRLRLAEGIDECEVRERFGRSLEEIAPSLHRWLEADLMQRSQGRVSFTDRGFFVSNAILSELL